MSFLHIELSKFLEELRQTALPEFYNYSRREIPEESLVNYEEELKYYATQMKEAVNFTQYEEFNQAQENYHLLFQEVNEKLAKHALWDLVAHYQQQGKSEEASLLLATEELWRDPRYRFWLSIDFVITCPKTGQKVSLVGTEEQIPEDGIPYILVSEIGNLKQRQNPWAYIAERSRNEDYNHTAYA